MLERALVVVVGRARPACAPARAARTPCVRRRRARSRPPPRRGASRDIVTWVPRLGRMRGISSWRVELVRAQLVGPHAGRVDHVGAGRPRTRRRSRCRARARRPPGRRARPARSRRSGWRSRRRSARPRRARSAPCARRRSGSRRRGRRRSARAAASAGASSTVSAPSIDAVALRAPLLAVLAPAAPGHDVVHVEPDPGEAVGALALEARHEQRQRLDQVRRQLDQQRALEQRLADQPEVEVLEVAQAAVDQLRGAAGGAGGEVGRAPAARRCSRARPRRAPPRRR